MAQSLFVHLPHEELHGTVSSTAKKVIDKGGHASYDTGVHTHGDSCTCISWRPKIPTQVPGAWQVWVAPSGGTEPHAKSHRRLQPVGGTGFPQDRLGSRSSSTQLKAFATSRICQVWLPVDYETHLNTAAQTDGVRQTSPSMLQPPVCYPRAHAAGSCGRRQ